MGSIENNIYIDLKMIKVLLLEMTNSKAISLSIIKNSLGAPDT